MPNPNISSTLQNAASFGLGSTQNACQNLKFCFTFSEWNILADNNAKF